MSLHPQQAFILNMPVNPAGTAADSSGSQPPQLFFNKQLAALQQIMQETIHEAIKGMGGQNLNLNPNQNSNLNQNPTLNVNINIPQESNE